MNIRRATRADAAGIADARRRSITEVCATHYTPEQIEAWVRPDGPTRLEELLETAAYWVVESDGRIEGYGVLAGDRIMGLYLAPPALGRGLGRRLLAEIERQALAAGLSELSLRATLNAVGFYRAHGYVESGPESARLRHGVALPSVPMVKRLRL